MKQAKFSESSPEQLIDLRTVRINTELPLPQRAEQYLRQVGNPYLFKVDGLIVQATFSGTQSLTSALLALG